MKRPNAGTARMLQGRGRHRPDPDLVNIREQLPGHDVRRFDFLSVARSGATAGAVNVILTNTDKRAAFYVAPPAETLAVARALLRASRLSWWRKLLPVGTLTWRD